MIDPVLLPRPREATWRGDEVRVPAAAVVERRDATVPSQGYRLHIDDGGVTIDAADDAGAFYARRTLDQLLGPDGELPAGLVVDHPDVALRGVMLDVSRDKVPTLETLETLIDRLASWKINHVELYMEHTFAYAGHDEVWASSSPYTAADIRRLDAFCAARFVELTPNQNCLGHFERWLAHDRYRPLAIRPDGWTDARGRHRRPTTLEPTSTAARALVAGLVGELLDSFTSRRVHLGLDEPWELPDDRFDDYIDFVGFLRSLGVLEGRQVLMWGDIVASHPERLGDLPEGVTICEWGYEADHPFAERAERLAATGRPFWLSPGTSSWNSLVGRVTNMVANVRSAAEVATATGAEGVLATDWGDNGHLQYLPVSEPGFAYAAATTWCATANVDLDLGAVLSRHTFADATGSLARGLLALGDAHRLVTPQVANNSILVLHLLSPRFRMGEGITAGLEAGDLDAVEATIAAAHADVVASASQRADAGLVQREVDASAALLDLLVRDARARLRAGGRLEDVDSGVRARLAEELGGLIETHRSNWLARNRPGGLDDSAGRLHALRRAYLSAG